MRFFSFILLFLSINIFSQENTSIVFNELVIDPFFACVIKDNQGNSFNVANASFFDEYNSRNFFFWTRRNSALYSLNFKNIKSMTFSNDDFSDTKYERFTRCTLELVTGEAYDVYVKTTGYIEGFDQEFGSPVAFYLHYNLITSIEFNHTGEYSICPFCGTIYFSNQIEVCVFDKTPLVKGVLIEP